MFDESDASVLDDGPKASVFNVGSDATVPPESQNSSVLDDVTDTNVALDSVIASLLLSV